MYTKKRIDLRDVGLFLFVVVACVYPVVFAMYRGGFTVFSYPFASDIFYYARIARESDLWFYTYDGVFPTNGFHPLWQFLLTALYKVVGDDILLVHLMGILSIALTTIGYVIFAFALRNLTGSAALPMLLVPGLYYVVFGVNVAQNAPWSYMNGMESPLSILFGALLIREAVLLRQDPVRAESSAIYLRLTVLATLLVFARLDDVFLLAGVGAALLLTYNRPIIMRALPWAALPVAAILLYVLLNKSYADMWLPVSGELKGGGAFVYNFKKYIYNAFPPVELLTRLMHWRIDQRLNMVSYFNLRILQATVPLLVGAGVVWAFWRDRGTEVWLRNVLFVGFAIYMILKALYNIFLVNITQQGEWYYPFSLMLVNLFLIWSIAVAIRKTANRLPEDPIGGVAGAVVAAAAVLLFVKSTGQYLERYVQDLPESREIVALIEGRDEVAAALDAIDPKMGLIEMENGYIGFALPKSRIINGKLWVIDREAAEAFNAGRFLTLAHERGLDVITSLYHGPWGSIYREAPGKYGYFFDLNDPTAAMLLFLDRKFPDARNFTYKLIYQHEASGAYFVRMTPISEDQRRDAAPPAAEGPDPTE